MARAYSSPFGEIPSKKDDKSASEGKGTSVRDLIKVVGKSANDPNDPKRDQAQKLLKLLGDFFGDEDDSEASEKEVEDATRPKGMPPAEKQASRLSPYAAMLDEAMGLATPKGVRNEGTQLILSSGGFKVKP